ncbi:MAG TPA: hypothetical protein VGW34_07680 [Allosphingosinicella sp.]|nr:hypothetical protein [Allosphingosinicella sp.]
MPAARRSRLIACAVGAALVNLAWLAATGFPQSFRPPERSRYELPAQEAHEATIGRLVECGATQIWFEDIEDPQTQLRGRWVLEASRRNQQVVACFEKRRIGGGVSWRSY